VAPSIVGEGEIKELEASNSHVPKNSWAVTLAARHVSARLTILPEIAEPAPRRQAYEPEGGARRSVIGAYLRR
jgi:hypothetical protein